MFTELTPRLVFVRFTTTPPHSATPFALVDAARPIEVLFVQKLCVSVFTNFRLSNSPFLIAHPYKLHFEPVSLFDEQPHWSFLLRELLEKLIELFLRFTEVRFQHGWLCQKLGLNLHISWLTLRIQVVKVFHFVSVLILFSCYLTDVLLKFYNQLWGFFFLFLFDFVSEPTLWAKFILRRDVVPAFQKRAVGVFRVDRFILRHSEIG